MTNEKSEVFEGLKRGMMQNHTAVNPDTNPVAQTLETLGAPQLGHIIGQYSLFPSRIVSLLYTARETARTASWSAVAEELTRNIGEELGTESDGTSHYDMLLHGIADIAGENLYSELKRLAPSPATRAFLQRVEAAIESVDVAYAIGATYALESSAVPELIIVQDVLTRYLQKAAGRPIEGTLKTFFDMHLGTWEPGHEQGLYSAVPRYLKNQDLESFRVGFEEVMTAMDVWWSELYKESKAQD